MEATRLHDAWELARKAHDQNSFANDMSKDIDEILDKGTLKDLRAKWFKTYKLDLQSRLAPVHKTISVFHRMWEIENGKQLQSSV